MKKNDLFEMIIEDMSKDGEGIGHVDGLTIFVKDTAPGDRIRARVMKEKKNLAYARLEEVLEPSPYRVTPVCPKARACGGCTLQHISYEKQKELLERHVANCLTRIGGVEHAKEQMEPLIGMEDPYHFRNKMQFPVGLDSEGVPQLGFYAGRTHALIPLTDCPAGHSVNKEILSAVRGYLSESGASVYDEERHMGLIRHVLTRVGFSTGEVMVCIVANGDDLPKKKLLIEKLNKAVEAYNRRSSDENKADATGEKNGNVMQYEKSDARDKDRRDKCNESRVTGGLRLASVTLNINREKTNRILGFSGRTLYGNDYIEDTIEDIRFRIAPESFFQVNPVQTEKLYRKALEYAELSGEETVWDMYCGIGTISLFLARKAKRVFGVEIVPQAIENAKENSELNGFSNTEFFVGKAEDVVPNLYKKNPEKYRADVVVVDPPRKGCDEILLQTISEMQPGRIVYVSCDPATLARDIKILTDKGYTLRKAVPVDLFPQSMHVETIVLLQRTDM